MKKSDKVDVPQTVFDDDFIDAVKYMLYHTNVGGHAGNPPHPSWYNAASNPENSIKKIQTMKDELLAMKEAALHKGLDLTGTALVVGARMVMRDLQECGFLKLDEGRDHRAYTKALFDLFMKSDAALLEWLAAPTHFYAEFYDHEATEGGRLRKCKARLPMGK